MSLIKKYRIQELIDNKLPRRMTLKTVYEYLDKHYGVKPLTFWNHRNIALSDTKTISEDYLQIYAHFFEVPMHEILNYSIAKTKTINDLIHENQDQSIPKLFKVNGNAI